jgi:hypothetical protein
VNLTTTRQGPVPLYIGADLTDGTVRRPRPVDGCGLDLADGGLVARFWTWRWEGSGIPGVVEELRSARCSLLDAPQALAAAGAQMRACERATGAAGKTPDDVAKTKGRVFGGFVRSSLELFGALHGAGVRISPAGVIGGVGEVYPGELWMRLAGRLAKKTTRLGREQRRAVLGVCSVRFGEVLLTHDQLDAALAALVAAAADQVVPGLTARCVGAELRRRPTGELEEGPLVTLDVAPSLFPAIQAAVAACVRRS